MRSGNKAEKAYVTVSPTSQPHSHMDRFQLFFLQTLLMLVPHHSLAIVKEKKKERKKSVYSFTFEWIGCLEKKSY